MSGMMSGPGGLPSVPRRKVVSLRARRSLLFAVVPVLLFAAACGGDDDSAATETGAGSARADTPAEGPLLVDQAETALPAVDVVDVTTGEQINLQSLAPSNRPLLLWFWAPH